MQITWTTQQRKISELKAYHKNPRKLSKDQFNQLKASLDKFDYVEIAAINLDNVILAGHMRLKVLEKIHGKKYVVDVRVPSRLLDEKEVEEYVVRSNKNTGEWDFDILANEYEIANLVEWGFTPEELSVEVTKIDAEEDDEPEAPPIVSKSQNGDLYILGEHKLYCGDSTQSISYESLALDVDLIDLTVTDPPYNVNYEGKTKDALKIKNDKMSDDNFVQFLLDFYSIVYAHHKAGAAIYVFHADLFGHHFRQEFLNSGFKISECLIWIKNSMVMGRSDYHWKHEPILYGWKEGEAHSWYSDRKQTTVLEFDRPNANKEHPTMKPIKLVSYLIENSSKTDDIVFDGFGGSGSTLIACEQMQRKCRIIELDPRYCDVIVSRWVKYRKEIGKDHKVVLNNEEIEWET